MEDFHKKPPVDKDGVPLVLPFVRKLLPNASEQELIEATENVRRYVFQLYRIAVRLQKEGKLPLPKKKRRRGRGDEGTTS